MSGMMSKKERMVSVSLVLLATLGALYLTAIMVDPVSAVALSLPLGVVGLITIWTLLKGEGIIDPNSPEGLRMRAAKLPNVPYRFLLELTATQVEHNVISEETAKLAVSHFRTGQMERLVTGLKLLQLSHEQSEDALSLLNSGVIKDWKELTKN